MVNCALSMVQQETWDELKCTSMECGVQCVEYRLNSIELHVKSYVDSWDTRVGDMCTIDLWCESLFLFFFFLHPSLLNQLSTKYKIKLK